MTQVSGSRFLLSIPLLRLPGLLQWRGTEMALKVAQERVWGAETSLTGWEEQSCAKQEATVARLLEGQL